MYCFNTHRQVPATLAATAAIFIFFCRVSGGGMAPADKFLREK